MKKQITCTFPEELTQEPIIYNLGLQFNIVTNVLRADISESKRWMMLELEGEDENIEQGISWITSKGVRVESS